MRFRAILFLIVIVGVLASASASASASTTTSNGNRACPSSCSCLDTLVECRDPSSLPSSSSLPIWVQRLVIEGAQPPPDPQIFASRGLSELQLERCGYKSIPRVGAAPSLRALSFVKNEISELDPSALESLTGLESLSLEHNKIISIEEGSFPPMASLRSLQLSFNSIRSIDKNAFFNLANLEDLKLSRNRIERLPSSVFYKLPKLRNLELNGNRISEIDGMFFRQSNRMIALDLRHNRISSFRDGSFFGLNATKKLKLDRNRLSVISKGWTYGLDSLISLSISRNKLVTLEPSCWEPVKRLNSLDLSDNKLQMLGPNALEHLSDLKSLRLDDNEISYVDARTFSHVGSLETLNLSRNRLSWTVEDMSAPFSGLRHLGELYLAHNHVKSVGDDAFVGLEKLSILDLSGNNIMSLREKAFTPLEKLRVFHLNASSLLCDCDLKWFSYWPPSLSMESRVKAVCGYPNKLHGKPLSKVNIENFICDDSPKPRIYDHPKSRLAIKGENARLSCKAVSNSASQMEFIWRRNDINISNPIIEESIVDSDNISTKVLSELLLNNVSDSDAGRYQCIVSNSFGVAYSNKSQITIVIYPKFIKVPANITVNAGETAKLECAATGDPPPEIAWRKDGGNDFFAAIERRMHVMPADDAFFIVNSKVTDMGVYSCTAQNIAGYVMSNATLTVLEAPHFVKPMEKKEVTAGESIVIECMVSGSPKPTLHWLKDRESIKATERHFFTAEDQLLIIVKAVPSDEGIYECEITNFLGTVKDSAELRVLAPVTNNNEEDMMGIIIITVVCCAVVTSIVWVFIIYHTKRRMNRALPHYNPDSLQLAPLSMEIEHTSPQLFNSDNVSERSSCKDSGTGDSAKRSSLEIIPSDDIQQIGANTIVPMYLNSSIDENRRLLKKDDNIKAFYSEDCEHSVTVQMHVSDNMLNENLNRTYPYS